MGLYWIDWKLHPHHAQRCKKTSTTMPTWDRPPIIPRPTTKRSPMDTESSKSQETKAHHASRQQARNSKLIQWLIPHRISIIIA